MMAAMMGDYAIKGDAALYYASDRQRGLNDHSAGFMNYQKKRMLYIEETTQSRWDNHCYVLTIYVTIALMFTRSHVGAGCWTPVSAKS